MEFMDAGSLEVVAGIDVPEDVLARITRCMVEGLKFLKDELKIMHRGASPTVVRSIAIPADSCGSMTTDVKPTNVLLSKNGAVKLCDFGVSGQLDRSLAKTNIGCQSYMAVRGSHVHLSLSTPMLTRALLLYSPNESRENRRAQRRRTRRRRTSGRSDSRSSRLRLATTHIRPRRIRTCLHNSPRSFTEIHRVSRIVIPRRLETLSQSASRSKRNVDRPMLNSSWVSSFSQFVSR